MRKSLVLILLTLCSLCVFCQDSSTSAATDTTINAPVIPKPHTIKSKAVRRDTVAIVDSTINSDSLSKKDSVFVLVKDNRPNIVLFKKQRDTSILEMNSVFRFTNPMRYSITIKKWQGKEIIFYSIIALLIFFGLIRNGFNRYVGELFKTYFRTGINQKQAKEQLLQNPLPSLLLNLFFVLSGGIFIALLLQYFKLGLDFNFWWLYLYCALGLMGIYLVKFISLKFIGWIFQVTESTDGYIFIVFTTNKVISIALLPFLVMLAFTYGFINEAAMTLSLIMVSGLLAYRFFLSYISIRRQIRISFFHFLL